MRGYFERADGLVMPNNITIYGARLILEVALRAVSSEFWLGLVNTVPDPRLQQQNVGEPALGVGGYGRVLLTRDRTGWPHLGQLNDEPYLESRWVTFEATAPYSKSVNRLALFDSSANVTGDGIISVGSAWSPPSLFTPGTPQNLRTFRYRLFLR